MADLRRKGLVTTARFVVDRINYSNLKVIIATIGACNSLFFLITVG